MMVGVDEKGWGRGTEGFGGGGAQQTMHSTPRYR